MQLQRMLQYRKQLRMFPILDQTAKFYDRCALKAIYAASGTWLESHGRSCDQGESNHMTRKQLRCNYCVELAHISYFDPKVGDCSTSRVNDPVWGAVDYPVNTVHKLNLQWNHTVMTINSSTGSACVCEPHGFKTRGQTDRCTLIRLKAGAHGQTDTLKQTRELAWQVLKNVASSTSICVLCQNVNAHSIISTNNNC